MKTLLHVFLQISVHVIVIYGQMYVQFNFNRWIVFPNKLYQFTLSSAAYECWHLLHILISIWSNLSFHFSRAGALGNFCIFLMINGYLFCILISPLDILSWEGRACCCLHIKKKNCIILTDLWDLVHILDIRKSFVECTYWKYLLPLYDLPFHFLTGKV